MSKIIFADGFIFKPKHEKAPDWIRGGVSIKANEAIAFIEKHKSERGWLDLDLCLSKSGDKYYFKLNTYNKENPEKQQEQKQEKEELPEIDINDEGEEIDSDQIPFN